MTKNVSVFPGSNKRILSAWINGVLLPWVEVEDCLIGYGTDEEQLVIFATVSPSRIAKHVKFGSLPETLVCYQKIILLYFKQEGWRLKNSHAVAGVFGPNENDTVQYTFFFEKEKP